jgi:hypothetical protein
MTVLQAHFEVLESASQAIVNESENALDIVTKLDTSIATAKASATLTGYGIDARIKQLKTRLDTTARQLNIEGKQLRAILNAYRETEKKLVSEMEGATPVAPQ